MKQKMINAHMKVAETYAKLSSARRLQVGCVVVKNDTIIGIGYNGMPSGWVNDCEYIETPTLPYIQGDGPTLRTKPEVIHAEINAISKIARSTNSSEGSTMFITHAPCIECAKALYQSGIKYVFYNQTYRTTEGIDFLKKAGILINKVEE